jgi:ABC-2 type transport system permease protein
MNAFAQHFSFEFRAGVRNKTLLLLNYLFPLGFFLLGSLLLTGVNPMFKDTMIAAMIFFAVVASALLGMPDTLVAAREAGIFRSFRIHGIPELSILAMPALTTAVHTIIVALVMYVLAPPLFGALLPGNGLALVLAFVLLAFACIGIGLLLGVISPSTRATVLLAQAIFLPSMLIGGLMMPSSMLPDALGKAALLLPTTHAMNIVNALAYGAETAFSPYVSMAVLLAGGVIAVALAAYLFNWDAQNQTRRGHPMMALLALLPYAACLLAALLGLL